MKKSTFKKLSLLLILISLQVYSQDSVAVTFQYKHTGNPNIMYLAGSFNNWANNNNGVISDPLFGMNYDSQNKTWYKQERLLQGTYYYKFNENGSAGGWLSDPMNFRMNSADNNNSILKVSDPMVFYLQNQSINDLQSPAAISCYLFSSDNNPINRDSIFISVNDNVIKNLSDFYDTTRKYLNYPISLGKGTYKIKVFVKNLKGNVGEDSSTIEIKYDPYRNTPVPYEFIMDPNSSYITYKNITSINVPGIFNSWNNKANSMTYLSDEGVWKTAIDLLPGEYEYKFYINNSDWAEDPDNPLNRGNNNNSLIIVKSIETPSFKDFSSPNGIILSDSTNKFILNTKIYQASSKADIDPSTISVLCDGTAISHTYDNTEKRVNITLSKDLLITGVHNLVFQCSDASGKLAKQNFSFAVFPSGSGFINIDDYEDENLSYPDYIPRGSADIEYFNITSNQTADSLIFSIKMNQISDYTRIGLQMYNSLNSKYGAEIPNVNLQTNDWSDQGLFISLMNPTSLFCDTSKNNVICLSKNPLTKSILILPDKESIKNNKFVFKISVSDLNNIIGEYSDKRYYSLYSYLSDKNGNDLQINPEVKNQPMVYDLAFAKKFKQDILLRNFNQSRIARLDAEGRGIIGILPEQINPSLKSGAPIIKIFTRSNLEITNSFKTIDGSVNDPTVSLVDLYRNDVRLLSTSVTNGIFSAPVTLIEGDNLVKITAKNNGGLVGTSSTIRLKYIVDHSPKPKMTFSDLMNNIIRFDGTGSTDPDNDIFTFFWQSDDKVNPIKLNISSTGPTFQVQKPGKSGEYYFILKVTDKLGNSSTIRNYFILDSLGNLSLPNLNSNPQWVKDAIVYEIFVKSFAADGNLSAVTKKMQYFKDLGVNTLWLMPIMHNQGTVSEMSGGYSIDDFYDIAPQYGTLNDFRTLMDSAHTNGIKVVLDITQNHVADKHPWVMDIRSFCKYSNYYDFIERIKLGDDRGLGQSLSSDGIYMHYSNWSLPNLNLKNEATKSYMTKMFKWWLTDLNADGFRFDVYWGPQNRYGESAFWKPVRNELKSVKPDIFLLGETDGTGYGSEINYADGGGACDAAYDWSFYSSAKSIFSSLNINALHDKVINNNYYPGINSYFFRFLENHDEDRIAGLVNVEKNKALISLLMTIPGIPMIYMGQEVGWTGKRTLVNFNYQTGDILLPYYKRIINARKKFSAFRTKSIKKINSGDGEVYSYIRPYKNENGLVIINFSNSSKNITLNIDESTDLDLSTPLSNNRDYYLSDFSNDTYYSVKKNELSSLNFKLNPYEAKVMVLSEKIIKIQTSIGKAGEFKVPPQTILKQNYPNPFNPTTFIDYSISEPGNVKIILYDMLGREIKTLVNEYKNQGDYKIHFDASSFSNGIYLYKLVSNKNSDLKKMVILK